jgi:hypothetical protein
MSAIEAFRPQGNTTLFAATTTASSGQQISSGNVSGLRLYASAACFVAIGSSTISAALPTTSTPGNGFPLPSSGVEKVGCAPGAYISVITATGTANVYATAGEGV